MEKPSTLHLPSPDQKISARWLIQRIRKAMVNTPAGALWQGYNKGLAEIGVAVTRRARDQAAKDFAAAKRAKR